jgi:hypothetical protein
LTGASQTLERQKKAHKTPLETTFLVGTFFLRIRLTNTTSCGYNYPVPQNRVAVSSPKQPSINQFYVFVESSPRGALSRFAAIIIFHFKVPKEDV